MSDVIDAIDDQTYEKVFDIEEDARRSGTGLIPDPYPIWAQLQAEAPVHPGTIAHCMGISEDAGSMFVPGFRYFTVFNFAGVSDVFTRKDDFSSELYHDMGINRKLGDNILSMDGLRHRRYRNLMQEYFQPMSAGGWWNDHVIAGLVDQLVSRFEKQPSVDLNTQFFARLPMLTVTEGFGLSPTEGMAFRRATQVTLDQSATPAQQAEAERASDEILQRVIRARQAKPEDDMISRLAVAQLEEDDESTRPLTVEEITAFCRLIVFAGGGTTWRQLGITAMALLNNPDQLAAVRADRSLLQNTILESVRWNTNVPLFPRKAMRDTTLQGVDIPKGSAIHVCIGAANRDPSRWDNPDKFDIFRPIQRSLAFAAGAHSCLGQHVARQEIECALNALLDRFPNIRWDSSRPPAKLSGGLIARAPGPLPVLLH